MFGAVKSQVGVVIYPPTNPRDPKKKFFRIKWSENGKKYDTTAKTFEAAEKKAVIISRRLLAQSGQRDFMPISDLLEVYLEPRNVRQRGWGENHLKNSTYLLNEFVEHFGNLPCNELSGEHLNRYISEIAETVSPAKAIAVSRTLSTLINWGHAKDWFTQDISQLIREMKSAANSNESKKVYQAGESAKFVNRKLIPSHADVDLLAKKIAEIANDSTYELFVNLAAYSGLRIGEQIDLDVDSVDLESRAINVETQCLDTGIKMSRTTPKWNTVRTTTYPEKTPMGYPLASALESHVKKIKKQKLTPTLQDGSTRKLLFPDGNGGWLRKTNYSKRLRVPAQNALGWKKKSGNRFVWNHHSLRHVFCTYYLQLTNNNFQAVAIAAGHKSFQTTVEMYIGVSDEAMKVLQDAGNAKTKNNKQTTSVTRQKRTTSNSKKNKRSERTQNGK
jgi:integrase